MQLHTMLHYKMLLLIFHNEASARASKTNGSKSHLIRLKCTYNLPPPTFPYCCLSLCTLLSLLERYGNASWCSLSLPMLLAVAFLGLSSYLHLCLLKWDFNLLQHAKVLIDNYLLQIWTIYTVYWLTQCKILIQMLMCPWHCIILFHAKTFSFLNELNLQYEEIVFNGWMIYSLKLIRLLTGTNKGEQTN